MLHQVFQQGVLLGGELRFFTVSGHCEGHGVKGYPAADYGLVCDNALVTPDKCDELPVQCGKREGLDDVVITAEVVPVYDILLPASCGEEQDGHCAAPAYLTAYREAVGAGQHDVEHDDVKFTLAYHIKSRVAVCGSIEPDIILFGKIFGYYLPYLTVVLYKQCRVHLSFPLFRIYHTIWMYRLCIECISSEYFFMMYKAVPILTDGGR